jgi:DNA polymerase-1
MINKKPIVLVDGSSYLYRAFHALPSLTNSKGQPTGAIYGVINMLRKLINDYAPEHMAVIFDAKGKTFRDQMYDQYKAHRPPMPDELREQIKPLHELIEAMGLPIVTIDGVEADDVIGTLAVEADKEDFSTLISTGDKDIAQLVNDRITLVNTMNNTYIDTNTIIDKFGVPADQIIDFLTLIGDKVDNIPGVPKVGPKTAIKWLQQYGSLDEIIAHAGDIPGKVGENLRASLDQLPLSRQLVTIKCDVPLDFGPKDLQLKEPELAKLKSLFQQLEFKTWLSDLLSSEQQGSGSGKPLGDTHSGKPRYDTILTEAELDVWLHKLQDADLFTLDTETTSLDYMKARLVGFSFAVEPKEAAYVPVAHDYTGAPPQLSLELVLGKLRPLLENPDKYKLGQNLKYDMSVLANHGINLQGIKYDTMLESYVLNSTASRHDMDSLALKYLGHKTILFEDIAGKGQKQLTFNAIPLEQAAPYAAEDADITLCLHQTLWPQLEQAQPLCKLFHAIEMPLVPVLSRMERTGVLVDADMLAGQSEELADRMTELKEQAYSAAGEQFNLDSPKQIQEILFGKLKLPVRTKTPKGQPSTAEAVLQELALDYPLPRLILDYRSLSKLKSTYTDKLPKQINPVTGRVHTSYHQAVASTGRLSSSDPNLQNIPIRNVEGRRIRQAFIAPENYKIVAADYSQIELRILAHLSGDQGLLTAFAAGEDIHSATAAEVFGIPLEHVSTEQRRSAKAINFGLVYGMSAFGLARQLSTERSVAQEYIDLYFQRYPGVKQFMDSTRAKARETGYVETVFGRRLYLPEINSRNNQRRQYAERTAINAPMQGTAADIIKTAMIKTDTWLQESGVHAKMIMQVHDELVFEIAENELDAAVKTIKQHMVQAAELTVPLVVDVGIGTNWDEAH